MIETSSTKSILMVVAHPDDEVLGGGGLAGVLTDRGNAVSACIVSSAAAARDRRPQDDEMLRDTLAAADALGMGQPILANFPNIKLNVVPHLDLVQFIERAIESSGATHIFTHHPADLNDDHRKVSNACQAAARVSQRRPGLPSLQGLYFMEVLSSTDWAFPGARPLFAPNTFFEIGETGLERKIRALQCYRDVMRPMPHPRSIEAIRGLAAVRGAQSGLLYAEAFQSVFSTFADL